MPVKCKFIKKDSNVCDAFTITGSEYCFMHDPEKETERKIAQTKGGMQPKKFTLNNNEEIELRTAADAKTFLSKVINGVWKGDIPASPVATALGFLIRCYLDAHEKSEVEKRLDEIEETIKDIKHD